MYEMTLEEFRDRNRISEDDWSKSECNWEVLKAIGADHTANFDQLVTTAEMFARTIQRIRGVHSVRFRVKDAEHLLEKIVRKCVEKVEKYKDITVENYHEVVTDLVGIRALHLFKNDCFQIDQGIRTNWPLAETATAYVRAGDPEEFRQSLREHGLEVKEHGAGYRSVHYVATSQPGMRKVAVEIQVRTIFEEGWSEIDHKIRYPNFSDNALVGYFLAIFNRMAGSADEMGSFVLQLASALNAADAQLQAATHERDEALASMDAAITDAQQSRQQGQEMQETLAKLRKEMERLKRSSADVSLASDEAIGKSSIGSTTRLMKFLAPSLADHAKDAYQRYLLENSTSAQLEKFMKDNSLDRLSEFTESSSVNQLRKFLSDNNISQPSDIAKVRGDNKD